MNKVDFEKALTELLKDTDDYHWESALEDNDIHDHVVIVDDGEWRDEGKYSYLENCIIQNKETGDFYAIEQGRSGSYYSDYYYFEGTFYQVEKKIVQTETWVKVKKQKT